MMATKFSSTAHISRTQAFQLQTRQALPSRSAALVVKALFKAKTATGPKTNTGKKSQGNSIKAQQFNVGLGGKKAKKIALGFTKGNEIFVSRLAMVGIATSIIGEVLTGKGALQQLGFETGIPVQDWDVIVLVGIAFNLIAALLPATGTFVPDAEEAEERPKGALQDPTISLANPGKFFGVKGFGFTKENELFVGRFAQLGFAASLIGEGLTGRGILGQLNLETGIPIKEAEPLLIAFILFTLFGAVSPGGSGKFVDD